MMNAEIPILVPMWLGLQRGRPKPAGKPPVSDQAAQGQIRALKNVRMSQYGALRRWQSQQDVSAGWDLNLEGYRTQQAELAAGNKQIRRWNEMLRAVEQGLAVTYPIAGKISLASRSDTQLVQIAAHKLAGSGHFKAVPLLSGYVFRGIELNNGTDTPLLAGPYSAYVDGEFVGKGQLPLVATGQTFTVGLGIDSQLRCRRELRDKSDKVSLGSRVQTYVYKLTVESFKDKPVSVRLMDRMPVTKGNDMEVELVKAELVAGEKRTEVKLSDDAEYRAEEKPKGILRWDIKVPSGAAGAKAMHLEYTFTMKFAEDRHISQSTGKLKEMREYYEQELRKKR
jgi:uncharacterized protein (TIGR02231 family)